MGVLRAIPGARPCGGGDAVAQFGVVEIRIGAGDDFGVVAQAAGQVQYGHQLVELERPPQHHAVHHDGIGVAQERERDAGGLIARLQGARGDIVDRIKDDQVGLVALMQLPRVRQARSGHAQQQPKVCDAFF